MAGFLVFPLLSVQAPTENPSLTPAPSMGFNNWARFECDLDETFFTETAQAMLKGGLLDVGYGFLTLDDRWMLHDRVEDGSLEWDTDKFPHGIPWLANYMKRNGLHFGIYQEAGPRTRAWDSIMYNYDFHERLTTLASLRTRKNNSHFALWASIGAPLILSAYIPSLSGEEIAFLSKKALIAVNQDPLGQQSALVSRDGTFDVLADAVTTTVSFAPLGLSPQSGCNYDARNLVTDEVLTIDSAIEIQLDSHVAKVYRIALPKSCTKTTSTGMVFNTPSGLCMTASTDSVIFEKCSASDFQFWHVAATGEATKLKMSPLSDASVCLAAGDEDSLAKWQGGTGITWDHKYRVICAALLGDS